MPLGLSGLGAPHSPDLGDTPSQSATSARRNHRLTRTKLLGETQPGIVQHVRPVPLSRLDEAEAIENERNAESSLER